MTPQLLFKFQSANVIKYDEICGKKLLVSQETNITFMEKDSNFIFPFNLKHLLINEPELYKIKLCHTNIFLIPSDAILMDNFSINAVFKPQVLKAKD